VVHRVVLSPEAQAHLLAIRTHIERYAGAQVALDFTTAIIEHCASFTTFPERGTRRDDLRPGLRVIGFRRRISIAFAVADETITIIGIFYGGQDIEGAMRGEPAC
jgi:toxin ParE1/3/4